MADIPRSMTLADYLASMRKRRWQPGILDCGVFMADWVRALTGVDPIADVRGSYSTLEEFEAIVEREGGLIKATGRRLKTIGWHRTKSAVQGNIAVVLAPCMIGKKLTRCPTGAIVVNDVLRAVVTGDAGLVIAEAERLPTLKMWAHG